jgi:hypothetical protein
MEASLGCILFIISVQMNNYLQVAKPALVHLSKIKQPERGDRSRFEHAERMRKIIDACSLIKKSFFPPLLFSNCHLQLLLFMIKNELTPSRYNWIRELVELPDGEGKKTVPTLAFLFRFYLFFEFLVFIY